MENYIPKIGDSFRVFKVNEGVYKSANIAGKWACEVPNHNLGVEYASNLFIELKPSGIKTPIFTHMQDDTKLMGRVIIKSLKK